MIFQNPFDTLNPSYSVGSQILRTLERFRIGENDAERRETMLRLLDLVKLPRAFAHRSPRQLSGGQKQRIGVARAFAGRPRVIIADEPMSALDVSVQAAISELLMNLQRESKTTMVFISHDLSVVRYLADRVIVMYLGHIVEMGATEQIFSPPFHPYTEALLSAIPIADPRVKKRHVVLEGEIPSALSPPKGCPFQTRCGHKAEVAGELVRARGSADPRASPTATRSNATCRSRRSSAWSRCFRERAGDGRALIRLGAREYTEPSLRAEHSINRHSDRSRGTPWPTFLPRTATNRCATIAAAAAG